MAKFRHFIANNNFWKRMMLTGTLDNANRDMLQKYSLEEISHYQTLYLQLLRNPSEENLLINRTFMTFLGKESRFYEYIRDFKDALTKHLLVLEDEEIEHLQDAPSRFQPLFDAKRDHKSAPTTPNNSPAVSPSANQPHRAFSAKSKSQRQKKR